MAGQDGVGGRRKRERRSDGVLTRKEQSLVDALEPRAAEEGIEIVTVEVTGSKKSPIIRVYIDAEGGVGFDELSGSQAWMGELMDEIDPFPGAYVLEVSSPGIDRPLRTLEHFERFAGEDVVVKTTAPIDGRKSFSGVLKGVSDGNVLVEVDGEKFSVPYETIKKANVKGKFSFK